ncbi:alpha-amylase family glycosyl hydrolase [Gloeobacter kilaueensis]|uniref:Malto-oligosyltrehalose trehalohydrolase n=1 Tax=Gloeobacter kilaueensis (strain ATCC BAA-2537 / CCAP 1431/1 / ULC 316 / JS1) TaxID=1183438 RepID=U5QFM5_GLOK1|nr:alpha-amylase family glycosyl hydrolase [Gloeobacter kilaueensis]AGY57683.1 malto-oligosyltrehalose trehalohydrolase [Gloeobacter kilaueensis JS1]
MQILPLDRLGAREVADGVFQFGLLLPWVSQSDGNRLWVKIIHEDDQFLQSVQPLAFEMAHSIDPVYGDYWSVQVNLKAVPKPNPQSPWGEDGKYIYRYLLQNPNRSEPIDFIIDPFGREFGVGRLSAFTMGYQPYNWSEKEANWKTPALTDLIIYELMLEEFADDLDCAISRLDYLKDLGINCIEVMPVDHVSNTVDWGYLPIGYFGVDARFGKRKDFQRFVDEAHQRGIAVILDSVYGHTSESFTYFYVYDQLGYQQNPFMGSYAKDYFGQSTDFNRTFTQDFFFTVNYHWLDCYHVDGFRYDCVPNYYEGATDSGYANLTYSTYELIKAKQTAWQRFFDSQADIRCIQCAEQLEGPIDILYKTYSNCTWQNETLGAAQAVAGGDRGRLYDLGMQLGLSGYPAQVSVNGETIEKTALQYIENHDHSRFVCNFGIVRRDGGDEFREGNRGLWYKVQPYLIGLLAAKGIPLLWQGQEFAENYYVPDSGLGRVLLLRPVRWDYFYDPIGKKTIALVRKLLTLRRSLPQLRSGGYYFYNDFGLYQSKGLLLFSRSDDSHFSLIALNFGDSDQSVDFWFTESGSYREELHGEANLTGVAAGSPCAITIPSNYGRIWTRQ